MAAGQGEARMPVGRSGFKPEGGRDCWGHVYVQQRSPSSVQGSGLWVGAYLGQSTKGCSLEWVWDETGPLMGSGEGVSCV